MESGDNFDESRCEPNCSLVSCSYAAKILKSFSSSFGEMDESRMVH